jgi:ADP-ribose pyrophosphatase
MFESTVALLDILPDGAHGASITRPQGAPDMPEDQREPDQKLRHVGDHLDFVVHDGWEYVRRRAGTGVVGVVALTDDEELVLVEQSRVPVGCRVIELPAGIVGDVGRESVIEAGVRELEEETGFRAESAELLWQGPSSAGLTDEIVSIVRARGLHRVHPGGGVDGECIHVHLVPMETLDEWLQTRESRGVLVDLKVRLAARAMEIHAR